MKRWTTALTTAAVLVGTTPATVAWGGSADERGGRQAAHLGAAVPHASSYQYAGGHMLNDSAYRQMLAWVSE